MSSKGTSQYRMIARQRFWSSSPFDEFLRSAGFKQTDYFHHVYGESALPKVVWYKCGVEGRVREAASRLDLGDAQ